jgi:glycerol-3-phosphate dehydrogenase (NAD(P)+)
MGSNPRAALLTRGLAEIKRLAEALGGQRETVSGLAGIGDLTLTCSSEQSRNFSFGKALGEGRRADDLLANRSSVVEGVVNARSVVALAARQGVDMPICQAVDRVLHGGLSIDAAIELLMVRPLRAEAAGLEQLIALPHPSA